MGAAILGGGSGALGLGVAVFFHATDGLPVAALLAYTGALPVLAAPLGLHSALRSRSRARRAALLVLAAVLTLAGAPMAVVFSIGGFLALASAFGYLAALCPPRDVLNRLDPRL